MTGLNGTMNEFRKVDFRYFITFALQNKITWEVLDHFLNDLTPTLATSKQVIKVLLKELEKLQTELQKVQTERTNNEVDFSGNSEDSNSTRIDQTFSVQIQVNQTENNDQIKEQ